jgi:hypothetical protein
LQIESVGSAILLVAHRLGAYEPVPVSSYGSQNLSGGAAHTFASLTTAVQILAVVGAWILFASGTAAARNFPAACALAVAAFVTFGKVLSPQYLIWLVPLAALLSGPLAVPATSLFLASCLATQLWFPRLYWHLVGLETKPMVLLAIRDALLVALVVVLWVATAPPRARSRSA